MLEHLTIAVPTRGRVGMQRTLENLPPALAERTWLACPESEQFQHDWPNKWVHPEDLEANGGMGAKRQWVMDQCTTPVLLMLDDDLKFHVRRGGVQLHDAADAEIVQAAEWLTATCLGGDMQAGLSLRGGNNRVPEFDKQNTRCTGAAFAVNVPRAREMGLRWDRLELMEDLDFVLQMLRAGGTNRMAYHWAVSQRTGSTGGCSTFRTARRQTTAARKLKALHPGLVALEVKPAGTWPGMGAFCDVRVSWRKASA